jgi:excisionase family DNA binding protein
LKCPDEPNVALVLHVADVTPESGRPKGGLQEGAGDGESVGEPQAFVTGGLVTVSEVAAAMRVSNMTVYRLIKSGELPALRVGKNYRLRESDVERFLVERSVRAQEGNGQG